MNKRVLIVDDSEANRLALRLELLDRSFAVEEAENGKAAIEKLRSGTFDAVVTDIWMPEADGIAVVQALQATSPDLPVFVITGGGPGLSIASASALATVWGAERIYVKPFDVRVLVQDIASRLGV